MHLYFSLVAFILGVCGGAPSYSETLVYLLGGQSNMYGVAPTADLTPPLSKPQSDVRYWSNGWVDLRPGLVNPSFFGPEVSFGRAMADAKPDDAIYLIKYAAGGTNLAQQWAPPNGPQYTNFKNTVDTALMNLGQSGIDYRIAGMLWMQGESDALNSEFAAAYETNLTNFIGRVRSDVRVPDLPFVMGRVLTYFDTTPPGGAATVRVAQQAVAEQGEDAYWFSTDDLGVGAPDPGHYTAQGQIDMGNRFASTLQELPVPGPPLHPFDLNRDDTFLCSRLGRCTATQPQPRPCKPRCRNRTSSMVWRLRQKPASGPEGLSSI